MRLPWPPPQRCKISTTFKNNTAGATFVNNAIFPIRIHNMSNEYRIWRSFRSTFAGLINSDRNDLTDETCTAASTYDDNELAAISGSGFNAIWVHGLLHHIVRAEPFLELGKNHQRHKTALRALIERAARHGIKVFIYMQPPRAIPVSNREFWDRHPDAAGQEESTTDDEDISVKVKVRSMCTSTAPVRIWLKNAARQLITDLPGLGGIILITASEFPAHCYSHRQKDDPRWQVSCPNCRNRHPADIVVEIINLIRDGVREASRETAIVAWDWGWTMWGITPPCHEIMDRLPSDLILMANFESGGYKDLWLRPHAAIQEYSLSYAGPSEACRKAFSVAQKLGMRTMSKLQLGTTHELATVVSLPLLGNIFKKASYHKHSESAGYMGCWNFGNYISTNTAAFNYFMSSDCPDNEEEALQSFGSKYFPGCDAGLLARSWQGFDSAMDYYPFCVPFIYNAPMNYTLAYPQIYVMGKLTGKPAGPTHLIVPRGDNFSLIFDYAHFGMEKTDVFTLDEIIPRLERLTVAWAETVELLTVALAHCPEPKARNEIGNAAICGAVWHSTANTFKIFRLRRKWNDSMRSEFISIARDELAVLHKVLPHVERDPRQGYHGEAHGYMFDAQSIKDKILALERIVNQQP